MRQTFDAEPLLRGAALRVIRPRVAVLTAAAEVVYRGICHGLLHPTRFLIPYSPVTGGLRA